MPSIAKLPAFPPTSSRCSMTIGSALRCRANCQAAATPAGPPPRITTRAPAMPCSTSPPPEPASTRHVERDLRRQSRLFAVAEGAQTLGGCGIEHDGLARPGGADVAQERLVQMRRSRRLGL